MSRQMVCADYIIGQLEELVLISSEMPADDRFLVQSTIADVIHTIGLDGAGRLIYPKRAAKELFDPDAQPPQCTLCDQSATILLHIKPGEYRFACRDHAKIHLIHKQETILNDNRSS